MDLKKKDNIAGHRKIAFYTLGCKLNFSETSTIARKFEEKGFQKVEFDQKPDIFIINTCSVTDNADKKCRKVVREAKKISPGSRIFVLGCYAQLKPREIASIPGVNAVLGAAEKFRLPELLPELLTNSNPIALFSDIDSVKEYNSAYSLFDRTRTFLKVQDGCNYSCTFCTIPLARGESRSDTIENVVRVANEIASRNVKEVVLTGVNTGDFGIRDGIRHERFVDLARELEKVKGIERYRISSIEPNLLTDEIIEMVASSEKFAPHFHIPLQSGSNKILKLMRRRYLRELYRERVDKIKSLMPHCCIGVDVIAGFPGETDEDFLDTYLFLNELDISYLHVFPYSERPDTHAIELAGQVPVNERNNRSKMLRGLSEKKRRFFYESQLGSVRQVLFEEDIENGQMSGFTENYIRVTAKYDPLLVNELKMVQLDKVNSDGSVEVVEPETVLNS
jgi:threonylcarbamoyladenosine tRNA methylthiotransferase MtaB